VSCDHGENKIGRSEREIIWEEAILEENAWTLLEKFNEHHSSRKESVPIQELARDFRLFL